jgi:hypothetical protein
MIYILSVLPPLALAALIYLLRRTRKKNDAYREYLRGPLDPRD